MENEMIEALGRYLEKGRKSGARVYRVSDEFLEAILSHMRDERELVALLRKHIAVIGKNK